ncbi:hypothetical protein Q9L42_004655 [Methylomarinum sp. Ch1-1]|uniref:Nucleotide modification associated domain-containing protein n=1 Tax=Methylomarinum roseum TaxID=3067653 RepID=A0AAU7NWR2_9GAMM|nr:hypothetical protein [Methylomarinum sp. Ch1-1]MDP4522511.1 hypothetical protein [Methylomarinum sp. Ch1-1]
MIEELTTVEESKIFIGYHGTSEECADKILDTNFKPSENPDDWLGYGIYFFVDGISDPINNAKEWATNQAWNGRSNPPLYPRYTVLSAEVHGKNVLDTNKQEDLKAFNQVRDKLLEIHDKHWKRNRKLEEDNRILWNMVADFMKLEIIIHNLYIKTKRQRQYRIKSNVPNVTVMCVKNSANICTNTMKKAKEGKVKL